MKQRRLSLPGVLVLYLILLPAAAAWALGLNLLLLRACRRRERTAP